MSTTLRHQPSFSPSSNPSSNASTPDSSQHQQSQSEASTAATTPGNTTPERSRKADDYFEFIRDPLDAAIQLHGAQRRDDVENATRITHATPGPTGPLGLNVGRAEEVGSRISTQSATVTIPVDHSHSTVAMGLERNAATIAGTTDISGGTLNVGVANVAGFLNANASFTSTGGQNVGALLGATTSGLGGAGISTVQKLSPSIGLGVSAIGLYSPNAKTAVTSVEDETVRIEREKSSYAGAQLTLSVGAPQAGIAARTFAGSSVLRQQHSDATPQQARVALKDNGFFRRRMVGMGFSSPFTARDAITNPASLRGGETAVERRTDSTANSAAIAAAGVHVGAHRLGVSASQVKLTRSNSGNKSSLSVNTSASKTKALSFDVPVLASITRANGSTVAAGVELELDRGNDPSHYIDRSSTMRGLSQSFNLPLNISVSSFADVVDPGKAMMMLRDTPVEDGVSIKEIVVSQRRDSTQSRGSLMPLTKTLFGNLTSNAYETNSADIRELTAGPTNAKVISGREQTTRKEVTGSGTNERTFSFLQMSSLGLDETQQGTTPMFRAKTVSMLVAKNTFEQCSVNGLNLLGKWASGYTGGPALVSEEVSGRNVPRFSASASVLIRLEPEDKLKLVENNFFADLRNVSSFNNAERNGALIEAVDERLTEMLKRGDPALKKLTAALNAPEKVAVNIEANLVDQLQEKANQLTVDSASPLPKSSGLTAAFKRRLAKVSELYRQTQRLKEVYNHPALRVNGTRRQEERARLDSLERQVLKVVNVTEGAELVRLERRASQGDLLAARKSSPVAKPTHRDAAQALATPVSSRPASPTPAGDIDLGTIPMSTVTPH